MFGAPADGIRGAVAPWMQIGATPAERYFGFRHARDQFRSIPANWKALGLDEFGGVKDVDANTANFGGTHLLTTDLLPASGSYEQAHASVFGDGPTPRRPGGAPVFEAAWRHLLGTPWGRSVVGAVDYLNVPSFGPRALLSICLIAPR